MQWTQQKITKEATEMITRREVEKHMIEILATETATHFATESGKIRAQEIRRGEMTPDRRVTLNSMIEAYGLGHIHQRDNI